METNECISLRFKQGSADKVYNASLEERDDGFVVNFAYGRFGKSLKSGTKTALPISYDRAKVAYGKLVASKVAKGYTPDAGGDPFTAPQIDQERTDLYPQLLNEVTREDIPEVLSRFGGYLAMQFKHDGERRPIYVSDTEIYGSNRRALKVGLNPKIQGSLSTLRLAYPEGFILDTEDMGESLEVFDVLSIEEADLRDQTFDERCNWLRVLEQAAWDYDIDNIKFDIPRYYSNVESILRDIDRAEAQGREGVVLRDLRGQYSIGKPNSWGTCLKLKFWQSVTCMVVSNHPTKRSIALGLTTHPDKGHYQGVGNCTVPTNYNLPSPGDLVEIKYMYAYHGGSIYQPQYKGVRTDLESGSAVLSQLKYKE